MNRRNFLSLASLSPLLAKNLLASSDACVNPITGTPIYSHSLLIRRKELYISSQDWDTFVSARDRLRRIKKYVGYGNFNILSFDTALFYARNYPSIGAFTKDELALMDKLFYENPRKYGFYGQKTTHNITTKISKKDVVKIPHTGHFLFKGKPLEDYTRVKEDIGENIVLTSGIRSVVKQMSLYMDKIYKLNGNITKASYSIAPPAYTFHALGDFDVGKKGFGYANFTTKFTTTQEFKELIKLDYIAMRYKPNNIYGVRYEPWHVEVI